MGYIPYSSLVPRLISQVLPAFHTTSDESLGDEPGNETTVQQVIFHEWSGIHEN